MGEMVQGLKCLLFGLFAGIVTIQGGEGKAQFDYFPLLFVRSLPKANSNELGKLANKFEIYG